MDIVHKNTELLNFLKISDDCKKLIVFIKEHNVKDKLHAMSFLIYMENYPEFELVFNFLYKNFKTTVGRHNFIITLRDLDINL